MNRMDQALLELSEMDDLASMDSPLHRRHPAVKLLVTVFYIAAVVSFGKYDLPGVLPMALIPAILFAAGGIPVSTCFKKMRFALPLVLAVGVFNPFFDRTVFIRIGGIPVTGGVLSMLTLMAKGVLSLMAAFIMMASTGIDSLCAGLRSLHVPKTAVSLLLLTWRYISVMTKELSVMTDAYHLRAPGQKGIHVSAWGSFLGQLLLRSMDRAGELYSAMRLRGFRGEFYYAGGRRAGVRDVLFAACFAAAVLVLRFVHVGELVGGIFV